MSRKGKRWRSTRDAHLIQRLMRHRVAVEQDRLTEPRAALYQKLLQAGMLRVPYVADPRPRIGLRDLARVDRAPGGHDPRHDPQP